ncbi:MAG: FUSC family protein [Clostridia bacterium]|nr:FUSC family protein [Clostridia bacterium]
MQKKLYFPYIGQRIVKTTIAVFLCLVFYYLRGYRGEAMSAEAAITAIICMQPYVHDTREYSFNRIAGTLIGAFWGFLFLLIIPFFPSVTGIPLYALMGIGVLISLYSAVVMRKPDASSLAAIVFVCVVIVYPDVEHPLDQAFHRVLDVLVGTMIAILINVIRLPRVKQRDRLFFVRTKDLAPDQLSQIPSVVLFRLNYLYNDGARICLISEHAPAFFISQMNSLRLSVPMIVMDGAGIYDPADNMYLSTVNMAPESSRWLMDQLSNMGVSYFIYTVSKNRNSIYHHGTMSQEEQIVYQRLKRSPYRQYLDEDTFDPKDIVYIKIVAKEERAERIWRAIKELLPNNGLRVVLRSQAGLDRGSSLYFYAEQANVQQAEKQLMRIMHEKEPRLKAKEVFYKKGYHSEHDAIHLMSRLGNLYEPSYFRAWIRHIAGKDKDL